MDTMPQYAQNSLFGNGQNGFGQQIFGSGYNPQQLSGGVAGLLGGLFGNSGQPYNKAMDQYQQYSKQAQDVQNPFYNFGKNALPKYNQWLNTQKNPSQFINNLMGQYQESPYAKYLQQQSVRSGQNAASASGLIGSTPFAEQLQQNASNISNGDMQNWLQNVLGINTQYGQGQQNLIQGGQGAANSLSDIFNQLGQNMGEQTYNKNASQNNDFFNELGGAASIASMFL